MNRQPSTLEGPVPMIFGAVIFGFFGFFTINWSTPGVNGQPVLFRELLGWTLRISAVLFAASAAVTFLKPLPGNLLYAMTGIVSAVLFIVVVAMDLADPQHGSFAYAPVILLLFAAWNGWGSLTSLRAVHAAMQEPPG